MATVSSLSWRLAGEEVAQMYEPDLKQMLSILPEDAAVCIYGIPRSLWRSPFGNQWCGDAMDVPLGLFGLPVLHFRYHGNLYYIRIASGQEGGGFDDTCG
jgi:hypothetical protein